MSNPIESLLVGRTLADRYLIEELIGRGGMSVVYRATDSRLGRPVAVKVVSAPGGSPEIRDEFRERLRREAAAAASIPSHPNVVQVYDYGTDPELDLDFIAMELLRGRDLKSALAAGDVPLEAALRILREAARGLAAGHRAGIVHRDVKPANIVLVGSDVTETVKILDFGIAKALEIGPGDDLTRTGHMPHSPGYASPEQLRGERIGPASDVYQLGLVGYELLAGERPFTPDERDAIRAGEARPVPERGRWRDVPSGTRRAIERALQDRPEDRPQDAAAFAEALAEARAADHDATALLEAPGRAGAAYTGGQPEFRDERELDTGRSTSAAPAGIGGLPDFLRGGRRRWLLAVPLVLLLVWALARGGEGGAPAAAAASLPNREALDEEFRELTHDAYDRMQDEVSDVSGEDAGETVMRIINQLHGDFARGDLEEHLAHYADRVNFYGRRLSRERVARERAETLAEYPRRRIDIRDRAVTFPEPGEALALYTMEWEYEGERRTWKGEARQELRLELGEDGRWRVVAEREREVFRSDRDRR